MGYHTKAIPPLKYVTDELATTKGMLILTCGIKQAILAGHEVVRLPVAHCKLNSIELSWSRVKHHVETENKW